MSVERFIKAHNHTYEAAFKELSQGKKKSHWMWYIFPQIAGLGFSDTAVKYAISSVDEAREYMSDPVLNEHMLTLCNILLESGESDAMKVFGYPDNLKLCSSMTLFSIATPEYDIFEKVLARFYAGKKDMKTLEIIEEK